VHFHKLFAKQQTQAGSFFFLSARGRVVAIDTEQVAEIFSVYSHTIIGNRYNPFSSLLLCAYYDSTSRLGEFDSVGYKISQDGMNHIYISKNRDMAGKVSENGNGLLPGRIIQQLSHLFNYAYQLNIIRFEFNAPRLRTRPFESVISRKFNITD
jgi:hypothetical protein